MVSGHILHYAQKGDRHCQGIRHNLPNAVMFLTPEGIKTLFLIFENSLCNKELAVETQHLKCTKTKWTFILCPKIFKTVPNHLERFSSEYLFMAIFWLKGEVGGNSQFVSS